MCILIAHAQEDYGTCFVCVPVCLSVTTLATALLVCTVKICTCMYMYMYTGVYLRLFSVFDSWILKNPSVQRLCCEKA